MQSYSYIVHMFKKGRCTVINLWIENCVRVCEYQISKIANHTMEGPRAQTRYRAGQFIVHGQNIYYSNRTITSGLAHAALPVTLSHGFVRVHAVTYPNASQPLNQRDSPTGQLQPSRLASFFSLTCFPGVRTPLSFTLRSFTEHARRVDGA